MKRCELAMTTFVECGGETKVRLIKIAKRPDENGNMIDELHCHLCENHFQDYKSTIDNLYSGGTINS